MSTQVIADDAIRVEGRSPSRMAWERLKKDRTAKISATVILIFIFLSVFAPIFAWLTKDAPNAFHPETLDSAMGALPIGKLGGVNGNHWFGVEPQTGRDLFLRFIYGARTSLSVALAATFVATVVGVVIGLVAGFFGGKIDQVLSRLMEIVLAFPSILFALAITPVLEDFLIGRGLQSGNGTRIPVIIVVLASFGWPYIARIVRGQVISLREREFVDAARALLAGGAERGGRGVDGPHARRRLGQAAVIPTVRHDAREREAVSRRPRAAARVALRRGRRARAALCVQ